MEMNSAAPVSGWGHHGGAVHTCPQVSKWHGHIRASSGPSRSLENSCMCQFSSPHYRDCPASYRLLVEQTGLLVGTSLMGSRYPLTQPYP